jgi:hypothetical protein
MQHVLQNSPRCGAYPQNKIFNISNHERHEP